MSNKLSEFLEKSLLNINEILEALGLTDGRGHKKGLYMTLAISIPTALIIWVLGSLIWYPIVGTILALITLALICLYGWEGLRTIPVGSKGIALWLGKRVEGEYPEGIVWTWPKPFGDMIFVDVKDKPVEIPLTQVLTKDNVPVSITVALQTKTTDLNVFLGADKAVESLTNATESDIRTIIATISSGNVAQEKQHIAEQAQALASGTNVTWGITVSKVRITHIRLPEEIEDANTDTQVALAAKKKEEAQTTSEMIEAQHIARMLEVYKKAGLTPTEAMNMLQAERGKATRIILDGGADPLVKAGALAGPLLSTLGQKTSSSSGNVPKGKR